MVWKKKRIFKKVAIENKVLSVVEDCSKEQIQNKNQETMQQIPPVSTKTLNIQSSQADVK